MADVTLESTEETVQLVSVSGASQGDITTAVTAHNASTTAHGLNANIFAALTGAASPSAGNVLATMAQMSYTINALDRGLVADHVTDNTAALQAAINALPAGGGSVFIPAKNDYYLFDSATPITIPSNCKIISNGAQLYQGGVTDANAVVRYLFELAAGVSNIMIDGLHFIGAHVSGATTNLSVVIRFLSTDVPKDISITNCRFENIVGYPIYGGDGDGCLVENCRFVNCGGGMNINNKSARIVNNYFSAMQALECSGNNLIIQGNVFRGILGNTIISPGGYIQASHTENNMIISGNSFYDFAGVSGISVGEDVRGVIISNNVFSHFTGAFPGKYAINFSSSNDDYKQRNILITGNVMSDIASGAISMIKGSSPAALSNVMISNNRIGSDDTSPVSDVFYGVYNEVDNVCLYNNYMHCAQYCLDTSGANTYIGQNDLKSGVGAGYEVRVSSPGSIITPKQYGDLSFTWKNVGGSAPVLAGPIVLTPDGAHTYRLGVANDGSITTTIVT